MRSSIRATHASRSLDGILPSSRTLAR
jgi:hypothetical protein